MKEFSKKPACSATLVTNGGELLQQRAKRVQGKLAERIRRIQDEYNRDLAVQRVPLGEWVDIVSALPVPVTPPALGACSARCFARMAPSTL